MMGALYEATRDMHHACERHPVGQRMALAAITPQEWADWLAAFRAVHVVIDPQHPPRMGRVAALEADGKTVVVVLRDNVALGFIALRDEPIEAGEPLLRPLVKAGRLVEAEMARADEARERVADALPRFPAGVRHLATGESDYPVMLSPGLERLQSRS
jgi:hypothetical protein